MKTARSHTHRSRIRIFWPILLIIVLFTGSSGSAPAVPRTLAFPHIDKVAHFFTFGLLATAIYRALPETMKVRRRSILAVVLVAIVGFFDELRQGFNPERTMDHLDWLADTSGAIVAVFVYVKWPFYRNLLETNYKNLRKRDADRFSSAADPGTTPVNRPAR
ncbi:MAG TPA: VanZ family protein [Opitutales bacterium]|nr:VanZ family protein [Opitutales bacterium]